MTTKIRMIGIGVVAAMGLAAPPPATAAPAQRTFVSSGGLDTNTCLLAAPCRGFQAALLQTNAGGEIVVLDSAGYGPVTINKAVSPPGFVCSSAAAKPRQGAASKHVLVSSPPAETNLRWSAPMAGGGAASPIAVSTPIPIIRILVVIVVLLRRVARPRVIQLRWYP